MTHRSIYDGVGLRLLAAFLITAMAALVREVSGQATVGQIVFWRSAVALVPIAIYMGLRGQFPAALRTRRPGAQLARGVIGAVSMSLSFLSLAYLPVAQAEALGYLAPVLVLPLAAWFLGEALSARVVLAVFLGFAGVLAMLWEGLAAPGQGALLGVLAGLGFAAANSVSRIQVKALTRTDSPATIAFYFAGISGLFGLATLPFGWQPLGLRELALLAGVGLLGGLAHIAATEAIARAPVSTLAPYDFSGMVWAVIFDAVLFAVLPAPLGWAGIAAITLAGILVLPRAPRTRTAA